MTSSIPDTTQVVDAPRSLPALVDARLHIGFKKRNWAAGSIQPNTWKNGT